MLALRPLLQRIAVVTRARRAVVVAACIVFPLFIAASCLVAPAILDHWNRRNPGLFELSNLLNQRKVMRHWAKKESGPTDRQLSIYVASHYRALLTNQASLSSAMALNLINGDQRRFALECLALHPAPTDNEIAEAETTVKKFLPRSDIIDVVGKPSFALMMLNWGLAI